MMKRLAALFSLALLMTLLTGCVVQSQPGSGNNNTVTMGPDNFLRTSITLKVGQKITFVDDKATGTRHILVIGTNGQSQKEDGAPDFGSDGITTNAGDSVDSPAWETPGVYHVTCIIHPPMNLTVTVTS